MRHKRRVWLARYLQFRLALVLYYLRKKSGQSRNSVAPRLFLRPIDLLQMELGLKPIRLSLVPKMLRMYGTAPSMVPYVLVAGSSVFGLCRLAKLALFSREAV